MSDYQLDAEKRELLAQQRAMKTTIGAAWFPLRDEIEAYVLDAAKGYKGDFVDSEASRWDFRSAPGIYLRMRVADAKDTASLQRGAVGSQRDAFVGCFLREPNRAAQGEPGRRVEDRRAGAAVEPWARLYGDEGPVG